VDQVVEGTPYVITPEYLDEITQKYGIDIIVHGDDPCLDVNGDDVFAFVKSQGKFRTVKRTEGVSTTELVGRMLLMTKDHHRDSIRKLSVGESDGLREEATVHSIGGKVSQFLPTTRRLSQFSGGKAPKAGDRIVYIDGSWDLVHPGHIEILKLAKEQGDFLLVGIHDDATVNEQRGSNWPIMNLHERTLCVLSYRFVDEVIIGAPWKITKDMITTMNISLVVHGTSFDPLLNLEQFQSGKDDPYYIPKKMGIYRELPSQSKLTAGDIVDRILKNREQYEQRFKDKNKKEQAYLEQKTYVQEI